MAIIVSLRMNSPFHEGLERERSSPDNDETLAAKSGQRLSFVWPFGETNATELWAGRIASSPLKPGHMPLQHQANIIFGPMLQWDDLASACPENRFPLFGPML